MNAMKPEERDFIKSRLLDTTDSIAVLRYESKWHTSHEFNHPSPRMDSIQTINDFVLKGYAPGDFIGSILCNDLSGTFKYADDDNIKRVFALVSYCYNYLPMDAWGSLKKVNAWMARFKEPQ